MKPNIKPTKKKLKTRVPRVLLIFPTSIIACRWMLRGILRYVHQNGPWELHIIEDREGEQKLRQTKAWDGTGIIGYVHNKAHAKAVLSAKLPAVIVDPLKEYLTPSNPISNLNRVSCDSFEIGRIAADYFLERHYSNFAFIGEINNIHWSRDRSEAFAARVKEKGFTCHIYPSLTRHERNDFGIEQKRLCKWLTKLPKPVAIMAAWDTRGRQVIDACMQAGIAVPQEAAVLSVDNDEILCETTNPPMSSIEMGAEEACYQAAKVLDTLMRVGKEALGKHVITYGAVRIVTRRSTEAIRIDDPLIVKALEFIWINVGTPMTVADVARHLNVSRRLLEIHTRKALGRTVHNEILRVRLDRAQALLRDTSQTINEISYACGFAGASHFGRRFKEAFQVTPSSFRANNIKYRQLLKQELIMPVYDYEAKEPKKSCPHCKDGFEITQRIKDPSLTTCPKCGNPVFKVITAPAIGRSKSKLDDRAKNAGFTKLKKISKGEYEKMY